jgi:TPR repeat protein
LKYILSAAALGVVAALCAGPVLAKKKPELVEARAPSEEEAARILSYARQIRDDKGCDAAAPSYRVVSAMGMGLEPAQHELGECLLTMAGASLEETALFREEALFWLKRAAFAGNARAQRSLSILYGAGDSAQPSSADALKWALVYAKNGDSDLYGYKTLPPTFVPGLKQGLAPEAIAAAEAFAAAFTPIKLGAYAGPPRPKGLKGESPGRPPSPERRRPNGQPHTGERPGGR